MILIRKRARQYCIGLCILLILLTFLWTFGLPVPQTNNKTNNSYNDHFISVKYVNEYDENPPAINRLVNLTNFKYLQKPNVCDGELGKNKAKTLYFHLTYQFSILYSNFNCNLIRRK